MSSFTHQSTSKAPLSSVRREHSICYAETDRDPAITNNTLDTLPREVRSMILEQVVVYDGPILLQSDTWNSMISDVANLHRLTKAIREEVLSIFFTKNTFIIDDIDASQKLFRGLSARFLSRIQHLRIEWATKRHLRNFQPKGMAADETSQTHEMSEDLLHGVRSRHINYRSLQERNAHRLVQGKCCCC